MCFSPQADVIGGIAVGVLGIDALRHVTRSSEIPIASLPLLLGAHQLVESFVWWGLEGRVPEAVGSVATWVYLLIAFVVLPPFVPAAIMAVEPTTTRRALMAPFAVIGAVVSVVLLAAMLRGPVTVGLEPNHLAYDIGIPNGLVIVTLYVVATCGSLMFSGYRHIIVFGIVNMPVVAVLALSASSGFASLWCAWAAVTSGMIAAHLRYHHARGARHVALAKELL